MAALEDQLVASPPDGVTSQQVADFFARNVAALTESLSGLLQDFVGEAGEPTEHISEPRTAGAAVMTRKSADDFRPSEVEGGIFGGDLASPADAALAARAQRSSAGTGQLELIQNYHGPGGRPATIIDDSARTSPGPTVRTLSGGAIERDVLDYELSVKGIWGRKRNPDFHTEPLIKGVDPANPKTAADLLPLMRKRLAELKVRPGASIELREQPVTVTKYPGQKYDVESHVLFSHRVLLREKL